MSRFSEPQDPLFQALNSSISFDFRLAPYDLEQSFAHARMLAHSGIISAEDLAEIERGLKQVCEEVDEDRFEVKPDDEDVHMAIERRLTELVGDPGRRLHTARSRNDQVATDVAMLVRAHSLTARDQLATLMGTLVDLAERHIDWPMPGYTHLQHAQPVYLAHHLLAYFWRFRRDLQRFGFCLTATDDLPLGAGALAGVNFDTSRMFVAQELGFGGIAENSLDAVSNRDFVLDYLSAAATCATHLSQLGAEIVLWSSEEFGFCQVADALRLGIVADAPEEEPRRRRAAARQGSARGGPARRPCTACSTACRSPTTRTSRRTRSSCSTRSTRWSSAWRWPTGCSRRSPSTASAWPPARATSCSPPPTWPTCS